MGWCSRGTRLACEFSSSSFLGKGRGSLFSVQQLRSHLDKCCALLLGRRFLPGKVEGGGEKAELFGSGRRPVSVMRRIRTRLADRLHRMICGKIGLASALIGAAVVAVDGGAGSVDWVKIGRRNRQPFFEPAGEESWGIGVCSRVLSRSRQYGFQCGLPVFVIGGSYRRRAHFARAALDQETLRRRLAAGGAGGNWRWVFLV